MATNEAIQEILRRTSQGKGTFPELAEVLRGLEGMSLIVPPAEMGRFLEDLDQALEEKGYGNVTVHDAQSPRFDGLTTKTGGFVPRVFTDHELAREYAVTNGLIQPDENLAFQQMDWVSGLHKFLAQGYEGIIIDAGSEHQINLERQPLARLLAVMTLEEFARLGTLQVVTHQGELHLQRDGEQVQLFVFDGEETARYGLPRIQGPEGKAALRPVDTAELLETAARTGVTQLVVNPSLGDARFYTREEIRRMLEILGVDLSTLETPSTHAPQEEAPSPETTSAAASPSAAASASPAPSAADAATSGAAELPEPMRRALADPRPPMVAVPEATDAQCRALLERWQPLAEKQEAEPWQLVEALAFETKLYVPLHFRNVEGLHWPQFFRHPEGKDETVVYFYTEKARVEEALSTSPPESQSYKVLAGIEALRWAWATPGPIDHLGVDWPDRTASFFLPNYWALQALFPLHIRVSSLEAIPRKGVANLGGVPGARGCKPEVLRGLLEGWKPLLEVASNGGTSRHLVEDETGRWVPLFSGQEAFFQYNIGLPQFDGKPRTMGGEPPFARWIEELDGADGLVLDPGGEHPLRLRAADLVVLAEWAERGNAQPDAYSLTQAAGRLVHQEKLSGSQAAVLAAEIPHYILGFQPDGQGGGAVMQLPETDTGVLFTDQHAWEVYTNFYRQMGLVSDQMQPVQVLSRWEHSALKLMHENFSAVHINPGPMGEGGLYLEGPVLAEAHRRLEEILKPRVPGFVWGEEG